MKRLKSAFHEAMGCASKPVFPSTFGFKDDCRKDWGFTPSFRTTLSAAWNSESSFEVVWLPPFPSPLLPLMSKVHLFQPSKSKMTALLQGAEATATFQRRAEVESSGGQLAELVEWHRILLKFSYTSELPPTPGKTSSKTSWRDIIYMTFWRQLRWKDCLCRAYIPHPAFGRCAHAMWSHLTVLLTFQRPCMERSPLSWQTEPGVPGSAQIIFWELILRAHSCQEGKVTWLEAKIEYPNSQRWQSNRKVDFKNDKNTGKFILVHLLSIM